MSAPGGSIPEKAPAHQLRKRRNRAYAETLLLGDFVGLLGGALLATFLRYGSITPLVWFENVDFRIPYYQLSFGVSVLFIIAMWLEGLYDVERLSWGFGEIGRAARALALGVLALIMVTYWLKAPGLSRLWMAFAWVLCTTFVVVARLAAHGWLRSERRANRMLVRTVVVGCGDEAGRIIDALSVGRPQGLSIVGVLDAPTGAAVADEEFHGVPVFGASTDLREIVESRDIETVIIVATEFDHSEIARMIESLRGTAASIHLSSGLFEVLTSRVFVREIAGVPFVTLKGVAFTPFRRFVKRAFDLAGSIAIIVAGLPLWIGVALAIKATSKGPVFYRQERIGQGGVPFGMYKFRSMVVDADKRLAQLVAANEADGPLFKMKNDPRVTAVGRWIRKWSIDEFPQLLNVVRGEMSLVGPRPPLPNEVEEYTKYHWRRLEVLPGMTGLWQVSGRSQLSFEEMVRLDLFYVENWSVAFDLNILARTLPAVLTGKGAY